ncbi:hypothetical protein IMG5_188540 [Ichthyophthirius multifiliis]|uniref:eIF3a PCI domain-containing protein n=1 Tax=Ichthyophthirius multifiliis TaxID=5932 RepID=G0R3Z6_ICHMU|nr:hypothetical protein IMG5_188540 [Ichthyophthirius multifiliis]EGR27827.1 hypothetical protein IMG5_188540 [Ichthyophthirius multifiliis]|eukprot:XP_004027172.1 hypothetical protein IMG5_188540 [Ichthyophthirius multifiliis]
MATSNILWQNHEQFLKNMEVQLEKTDAIKEALQQYKYLTQVQYANSLENVLLHIKNEVEKLFARKIQHYDFEEVKQNPDIDSEDPEDTNLMTSNLTIEQKQREIQIKNVLKIIYEIYKMIIETVKVHKKLEEVHIITIQKMLEFCDKYSRKTELKRFLEHQHFFLTQLQQRDIDFNKNPNHISLYNSETRDYLIQIRLDCTRSALKQSLYSYAFRQLEDISILINLKKVQTPIKHKIMSAYYYYLSEVFWHSKYFGYHSFFFLHHILIFRTNPQASAEEIKEKINQLILGVLSIPQYPIEDFQSEESKAKIASLQRNNNKLIPKKEEIISLVQRMNLNEVALEEIKTDIQFIERKSQTINVYTLY